MAARRVLATTSSGWKEGMRVEPVQSQIPLMSTMGDGDVEERLWRRRPRGIREQARPLAGRWRRSRERRVDVTRAGILSLETCTNWPLGCSRFTLLDRHSPEQGDRPIRLDSPWW
jgi:hypothetical protein